MTHEKLQQKTEAILKVADIKIDGSRPWDMHVHNDQFYPNIFSGGSVAFGEAYMDGWWDAEHLDKFFDKIFKSKLEKAIKKWDFLWDAMKAKLFNAQRSTKAFNIGEKHYDIGNDLYKAMLDRRMVYTCAYWENASSLDEAQEAKLDLVCRKIGLKSGDRVLDIGCGWGSFCKFAAERYGAEVVGITVSKEQVELAKKECAGLPVEIRLQDYRDVHEEFDHIISLGMFEHVGYKNYRLYMEVVDRCLKEGGLFLLHTIGGNVSSTRTDPWIDKYIFPDAMLPSTTQITKAFKGLFVLEDWHNFGTNYDKTLMAWYENFEKHWPELKSKYDERFYRMWKFYLLSSAGSFRSRKNQLWQIVLSKNGRPGGYESIR